MIAQDLQGLAVAFCQQSLYSAVDQRIGLVGAIQADAALQILILHHHGGHETQLIAHAVGGHHMTGQGSGTLDVVGSAGGLDAEHQRFSGTAAQQAAQLGMQLFIGAEELLFLGGIQSITQCAGGMGHDGDLGHRLAALLQSGDQGVTHFVVSDKPLFRIGQHGILLFGTGNDHLKGDQQIFLIHSLPALTDGPQRGFVHQIGKVSAHGASSGLGKLLQIHILCQLDLPGMDLQRVQSALQIGLIHDDPAVKTAGTQQRLIQDLGTVGGGKDHDTLAGIEAVDLAQQLVQCLVIGAEAGVTGAAHGIDLVDEDDAGCHLGSLLEQVTDTAGAQTHEHFLKIGTGHGEEGDTCLAGHGLGDQGLTGTGRANQQCALGQFGADIGVFLGVMQEVDDLLQAFLGLVLTGHVLEGDAGLFFHIHLGLGLAHTAHHAVAAHPLGQHIHEEEQNAEGQQGGQDHKDQRVVLDDLLVNFDAGIVKLSQQTHMVAHGQTGVVDLLLLGRLGGFLHGQIQQSVLRQLHFSQLAAFISLQEVGKGNFLVAAAGDGAVDEEDDQRDGQGKQQRYKQPGLGALFIIWGIVTILGIVVFRIHSFPP